MIPTSQYLRRREREFEVRPNEVNRDGTYKPHQGKREMARRLRRMKSGKAPA
jgi:hypothetical protein